jgi:hypothetical protein
MKSCLRPQGIFDNSACSSKQNLICKRTGDLAGYCTCNTYEYFDISQNKCLNMKIASKSCNSSVECRQDLGLSCVNGICECKKNYYWNDSSACSDFLNKLI